MERRKNLTVLLSPTLRSLYGSPCAAVALAWSLLVRNGLVLLCRLEGLKDFISVVWWKGGQLWRGTTGWEAMQLHFWATPNCPQRLFVRAEYYRYHIIPLSYHITISVSLECTINDSFRGQQRDFSPALAFGTCRQTENLSTLLWSYSISELCL